MKPGYPDRMLLHNHRIRMEQPRASPVHALAGEARDFAQRDRQATAPADATRAAPGRRGFRASPDRPLDMLRRCPAYAPTPLRALPGLAATLGLGALHAKDETGRMGLGSFKALGGAFAVAQTIAEAAGTSDPASDEAARIAKGMTFITASAGNHGLSLAAGARVFGARAVIVLPSLAPRGSPAGSDRRAPRSSGSRAPTTTPWPAPSTWRGPGAGCCSPTGPGTGTSNARRW